MKTYDEEYHELALWNIKTRKELEKIPYDHSSGRDGGERSKLEQEAGREYKAKLHALREKYNIL